MSILSYRAFDLHIQSELQLPELRSYATESEPDIIIRLGKNRSPSQGFETNERVIELTRKGVLLWWREIGSFLVSNGNKITIDPNDDTIEDVIRLPLLGAVIGTLLHQRGLFTLHASAVAITDCAVAFVGLKGAGKSTMAAALHALDHRIVTDDVLALDVANAANNDVRAIPGFSQVKLWPVATQALGNDPESLPVIHPKVDKRSFRPEIGFQETSVPLKKIYTLAKGDEISSEQLSQKEAFVEILTHSYAARFLGNEGAGRDHFEQCTRLVKEIPVYRLYRRADLTQLTEIAQFVVSENAPQ